MKGIIITAHNSSYNMMRSSSYYTGICSLAFYNTAIVLYTNLTSNEQSWFLEINLVWLLSANLHSGTCHYDEGLLVICCGGSPKQELNTIHVCIRLQPEHLAHCTVLNAKLPLCREELN